MSNLPKGWDIRISSGRVVLAVPPGGPEAAYRLTAVESTAIAHELATVLGLSDVEATDVNDARTADSGPIRWVVAMDRAHLVLQASPAELSGIYTLTDVEIAALALALIQGRAYVEAFIDDQVPREVTDGRAVGDGDEHSGGRRDDGLENPDAGWSE
ncbi:hypothetical protein [Mycobacteroides abscessus]|uniref:hypothetical protein n=1 Tax=Mycobacteroides abscessus TaxID=36809 RepID=UPI000C25736B|nr:hypothetical protein [Mycobacteroides abscessus]